MPAEGDQHSKTAGRGMHSLASVSVYQSGVVERKSGGERGRVFAGSFSHALSRSFRLTHDVHCLYIYIYHGLAALQIISAFQDMSGYLSRCRNFICARNAPHCIAGPTKDHGWSLFNLPQQYILASLKKKKS